MAKLHTFLFFLTTFLYFPILAQTRIGINVSSGEGYGESFSQSDYQIGIPVSMALPNDFKFLTGLEFSLKNNLIQSIKAKSFVNADPFCLFCSGHYLYDVKQFSYTYLQIPFVTKLEIKHFSFQMGIVAGYGLGGKVSQFERERWSDILGKNKNDLINSAINTRLYYKATGISRFDIAGRLGLGFQIHKFELGFKLNRSLRDLNLNSQFNSMYNTSIMVSLDYFFVEK
jgi:hypothetical protein